MSEPDLEFFTARFQQVLDDNRQTRDDIRSARDEVGRDIQRLNQSLGTLSQQITRLNSRMNDLMSEILDTSRMQVLGELAHAQTKIESDYVRRLDEHEQNLISLLLRALEGVKTVTELRENLAKVAAEDAHSNRPFRRHTAGRLNAS